MENFKWQHIQFADGSNPYVCTTEKGFKQMQKHYTLEKIKDGFWLAKANKIQGKYEVTI